MNEQYYSSYNVTTNDGTATYQRPKPTYDKELLWQNRMKYLGHKRSLSALYTCDIVLGIFASMIAKGELSNLTANPSGAFSIDPSASFFLRSALPGPVLGRLAGQHSVPNRKRPEHGPLQRVFVGAVQRQDQGAVFSAEQHAVAAVLVEQGRKLGKMAVDLPGIGHSQPLCIAGFRRG